MHKYSGGLNFNFIIQGNCSLIFQSFPWLGLLPLHPPPFYGITLENHGFTAHATLMLQNESNPYIAPFTPSPKKRDYYNWSGKIIHANNQGIGIIFTNSNRWWMRGFPVRVVPNLQTPIWTSWQKPYVPTGTLLLSPSSVSSVAEPKHPRSSPPIMVNAEELFCWGGQRAWLTTEHGQ